MACINTYEVTFNIVDNEEDPPFIVRTEGPMETMSGVDSNLCCLEFAKLVEAGETDEALSNNPLRLACTIENDNTDAFYKNVDGVCVGAGTSTRNYFTSDETLVWSEGPFSLDTEATDDDCCRARFGFDDPLAEFCPFITQESIPVVNNVYSDDGVCNQVTEVERTIFDLDGNTLDGPTTDITKVEIDKGYCCIDRAENENNQLACDEFALEPRLELVFEEVGDCVEVTY